MPELCHLHCHTQYSLLDGAAHIKNLVARAAELEIPALAITDHGNLFGVPEFCGAARDAGVQPIVGSEFYLCHDLHDRDERTRYHQVLLAKDEEGYRNLIALSSLSYTDGYYYKPRIDRKTLARHSRGLIATTCCLQGEVLQTILKRGEDAARKVFEAYLDIFGEDYYIEVQDHGIPEQRKCNAVLMRWAKEYGVKVIATNDVHYVNQNDAAAQDVLLCLQTGKQLNDPNRMRFENDQFFLKSIPEMREALAPSIEDAVLLDQALDTTREVADKCTFAPGKGELLMPHFPLPPAFGNDMDAYLRHLVYEGAQKRYPELNETVRERLDLELSVISSMGFAGYFLIVQDFTTAARQLGVSVGPGRGSAAGSAVAYCLGITNIDPLKYDLLFERFLNPERVSMPDIDIDFDDRGRGKVIDYVVEKYGRDSVCQIVTFGRMAAKSVIRDVARVLEVPLAEANRIAKLIPDGPKVTLKTAQADVPEFAQLFQSADPQIRKMLHYAQVLEGSTRQTGVHAAGVIIAPGRVSDYVPVAIQKGKSGGGGNVLTTQYDGNWVESFGLLKMDFLGLKTLTVLNDALDQIEARHGLRIDLDAIPLDDGPTFKLFQRGDTVGIFQFESEKMREWMRKLKPTTLDDLIAMNALYRPGPMDNIPTYIARKHGKEEVAYPHPMLEDILGVTYGIPVYQEQVMQMAQVMGGYSLGGADLLRRAMGKKKPEEMAKHRQLFRKGAAERAVDEKTADEVFDLMEKFAGYGFNKSHSAAYSVVAYQTAYLKANYPEEFMAAHLTNEAADSKKLAIALEEARRIGIRLLPPCVNRSHRPFVVEDSEAGVAAVRFGLIAVKGVGEGAIEAIVAEREKKGPYGSLVDLCKRVDLRAVNKSVIEALVRAGAFDFSGAHRAQLDVACEDAFRFGQQHQANKAMGQNSLFGDGASGLDDAFEPTLPMVEPWTRAETLRHERDLMGFYVSGHPLDAYDAEIRAFVTAFFGRPDDVDPEREHRTCGILTEIKRHTTKSGKPMAFLTVEDQTGVGEVVLFTSVFERVSHLLEPDAVVMIKGGVELGGAGLKVKANTIEPMWKVRETLVRQVVLRLGLDDVSTEDLEALAALAERNRGPLPLVFEVSHTALPKPMRLKARTNLVEANQELMQGLYRLFGRETVALEGDA